MTTATQPKSKSKIFARSGLLAIVLCLAFIGLAVHIASAVEVGKFTLSPASGTYTVGDTITLSIAEDSASEQVNAVEADLVYDPAVLQYLSVDTSGSAFADFGTLGVPASNQVSITRAGFNALYTGPKPVATISFKVLGAAANTAVTFAGSSQITRHSDQHNVWDSTNPGGANFVLKAVVAAPTGGGGSTTPAGGSSSGTSKSAAAGGSSSAKSNSGTAATSKSSTGGASAPATTTTPPAVGTSQLLPENSYLVAIYVHDSSDKPVENASVTLQGKTAKTDAQGMAGFVSVPIGSYDVKITVDGTTETQKITVSKPATDNQSLQKFTVKLAAAHNSTSWLIYVIVVLVIMGLGVAGFIIPRRNRFNGPTGMPPVAPENIVVGDANSKIGSPTPPSPETVIKPTITTGNSTTNNPDEEQKL